jgi:hypothetical protein
LSVSATAIKRRLERAAFHMTNLLAVFTMPKSKPTLTGPMRTQTVSNGSTMPTPVLPMVPTARAQSKTPQPKKEPTRMEAIRAAKAKITRLSSLQKQREALKG